MAGRYRTIVVDPPWSYEDGWPAVSTSPLARVAGGFEGPGQPRTPLPYGAMSVEGITKLPITDLADDDAHLYLWPTNRYLRDAFDVVDAWGFKYSQTLVWAKTPMGKGPGGTWAQSTEYVLFCRRGSLSSLQRFDSTWFNWRRMGKAHSRKPDAFLDMVEAASPGPYIELFARRARFGWDYWGDQSLGTAEMPEVAA